VQGLDGVVGSIVVTGGGGSVVVGANVVLASVVVGSVVVGSVVGYVTGGASVSAKLKDRNKQKTQHWHFICQNIRTSANV